jgi:hypothetical protein
MYYGGIKYCWRYDNKTRADPKGVATRLRKTTGTPERE